MGPASMLVLWATLLAAQARGLTAMQRLHPKVSLTYLSSRSI